MSANATAAFLEAIKFERTAENVAAAFVLHLARLSTETLTAEAQVHWRDVARLLRVPPDKPAPDKAVAAIRSWPSSRIDELAQQIARIHQIFDKLENERLEDEIRDNIRRHYL